MANYQRLTQEERYQIWALHRTGKAIRKIARELNRSPSTVSRELRRNRSLRGYRPKQAHKLAMQRRYRGGNRRCDERLWQQVEQLLKQDWSPEQISLWLRQQDMLISHTWIYRYIWQDRAAGGALYRHLRREGKRKRKYGTRAERRGRIKDAVSIEQRPAIVDAKERLGDWEADTIIGKGNSGVLLSLVERKSNLCLLSRLDSRHAAITADAIIALLGKMKGRVHTITADNGKEFAGHKKIAQALDAEFYFAHPYASWERGLNEHINGLVRQYFPKGMDFSQIDDADIQFVMDRLNNRPRKCLGMKTPNQVFFGIDPPVALTC